MSWQPMEIAPKDTTIILDVGLPWAVFGVWNAPSEAWCYANLQATGDIPAFSDTYFENEHEKAPKAWMPMPEIKREVPAQQVTHWSDCATNNGPAMEPGECDCGGYPPKVPPCTE